jgi:hypothetical protein
MSKDRATGTKAADHDDDVALADQHRDREAHGLDAVGDLLDMAWVELAHHVLGHFDVGDCKCLQFHRRQQIVARMLRLGVDHHCSFSRRSVSQRFVSINLAKPMETVEQFPFVLCAWPSFAEQPYITNYRIYDDRVGETTRFTYSPDHDWYWFPQQKPTEVSMLRIERDVALIVAEQVELHLGHAGLGEVEIVESAQERLVCIRNEACIIGEAPAHPFRQPGFKGHPFSSKPIVCAPMHSRRALWKRT